MATGHQMGWIVLLIATAAAVSGCGTTGSIKQSGESELVDLEKAMVMPPPGGPAIVGVVQKSYRNGLEQTLSLATSSSVPGQNYMKVAIIGGRGEGSSKLSYRPLRAGALQQEIVRAAPGVRLSRSPIFLQNSYGPFGYAFGHGRSGDACLYGWQQIRSGSQNRGTPTDLGMIQVRLRLCDRRATDEELLSVLYGYTITGSFDGQLWNPFGRPTAIDSRIGKSGQPIYPSSARDEKDFTFSYSAGQALNPVPRSGRASVPQEVRVSAPTALDVPAVSNRPLVPLPGSAASASVASDVSETRQNGSSTEALSGTVPSPDCLGALAPAASCK
ncbi:Cellulose biosynthesis protein BcsN [Rhizobium sp. NFR07]|nr:Cellulose biosynthesis protein BcsN [Rhizobium sp. NFR07]